MTALAFLEPLYRRETRFASLRGAAVSDRPPYSVEVREIPGLKFAYSRSGKLDYARTALNGLRKLSALARSTAALERTLRQEGADLVLHGL